MRMGRANLAIEILGLAALTVLVGCGGVSSGGSPNAVVVPGGGSGDGGNSGTTVGNFYVATNGNDSWSGTFATPQGSPASDGPFATVNRARIAVQGVAKNKGTAIVVLVRAGLYPQTALSFTSADSGSSNTPVLYQNYGTEVPVISGGMQVQNWTNTSGNAWTATLPAGAANFEALYYNGVRQMRPRLGSGTLGTYYRVAAQSNACSGTCYDRFYYASGDPISDSWQNLSPAAGNPCNATANSYPNGDIELVIFEKWTVSRQRISCIDTTNRIIYLTGQTDTGTSQGYLPDHRYIIENVKDQLSQPGQWFLDRSTAQWTLTYLANTGENPNTDTVIVPQSPQVLTASGLQWVTFDGITFSGDNFVTSPTGYASNQADHSVPAAVTCTNCSNVTFNSDTFTNITGYGLSLTTDATGTATGNTVENNAAYDTGAGGMILGDYATPRDTDANVLQFTTVQNNIVQGYGRMYPASSGIEMMLNHDMTNTHNEVNDGFNTGIAECMAGPSLCAGGPGSSGAFNIATTFNHIWNIGQGITDDMGGIYYATYTATGNTMYNNRVHDISDASALDPDGYGGQGLYIDNTTGLITVENNLVFRVSETLAKMTYGPVAPNQQNIIQNNILALGRSAVIGVGQCGTRNLQFQFSNNLVYQDRIGDSNPSASIEGPDDYLGTPVGSVQQYSSNMYYNTVQNLATWPSGFSYQAPGCNSRNLINFSTWQSLGEDPGSEVSNPGFSNPGCSESTAQACAETPGQDDFTLGASPGVGFALFDTNPGCATCPGRTDGIIVPPVVPVTWPTQPFNPSTDF
jgi:hypothetical protein